MFILLFHIGCKEYERDSHQQTSKIDLAYLNPNLIDTIRVDSKDGTNCFNHDLDSLVAVGEHYALRLADHSTQKELINWHMFIGPLLVSQHDSNRYRFIGCCLLPENGN